MSNEKTEKEEDRRLIDEVAMYSQAKHSRYRIMMGFAYWPEANHETREITMPLDQIQSMAGGSNRAVMGALADLEEMGEIEILEVKVRIRTYEGREPRFVPAHLNRDPELAH